MDEHSIVPLINRFCREWIAAHGQTPFTSDDLAVWYVDTQTIACHPNTPSSVRYRMLHDYKKRTLTWLKIYSKLRQGVFPIKRAKALGRASKWTADISAIKEIYASDGTPLHRAAALLKTDKYYTVSQAAYELKVPATTVRRVARRSDVPVPSHYIKMGSTSVALFTEDDIEFVRNYLRDEHPRLRTGKEFTQPARLPRREPEPSVKPSVGEVLDRDQQEWPARKSKIDWLGIVKERVATNAFVEEITSHPPNEAVEELTGRSDVYPRDERPPVGATILDPGVRPQHKNGQPKPKENFSHRAGESRIEYETRIGLPPDLIGLPLSTAEQTRHAPAQPSIGQLPTLRGDFDHAWLLKEEEDQLPVPSGLPALPSWRRA